MQSSLKNPCHRFWFLFFKQSANWLFEGNLERSNSSCALFHLECINVSVSASLSSMSSLMSLKTDYISVHKHLRCINIVRIALPVVFHHCSCSLGGKKHKYLKGCVRFLESLTRNPRSHSSHKWPNVHSAKQENVL